MLVLLGTLLIIKVALDVAYEASKSTTYANSDHKRLTHAMSDELRELERIESSIREGIEV